MSNGKTPAARVAAVEEECSGVWGASGITSWERERMAEWRSLPSLSPRQEAVMAEIEQKAFGCDDDLEDRQ